MLEVAQPVETDLTPLRLGGAQQDLRLVHPQHGGAELGEGARQTSPTAGCIQQATTRTEIEQGPQRGGLPGTVHLLKDLSGDAQVVLIEKRPPPFVHDVPLFRDPFRNRPETRFYVMVGTAFDELPVIRQLSGKDRFMTR